MARHKRRGLAGLGSAAGGKAVHSVQLNVHRYHSAFRDAQTYAGSDPPKALQAIARAKKALVDAEAGIMGARMNRVIVPPEYVAAFKAAVGTVDELNDLYRKAAALAADLLQTDPEWHNDKYGSAMPPPPEPDYWGMGGLRGLSGRGRRGCCPPKRRR